MAKQSQGLGSIELNTRPFFSVVIPVWNRLEHAKRAIASVLAQSYENFDVVVVDDGSSDEHLVQSQGDMGQGFTLIQQEHLGPGAARNTGIRNSKGQWISFLDSDDIWHADHLQILYTLIESFPAAGMVATSFMEVVEERWDGNWPRRRNRKEGYIDYFREASRARVSMNTSNVAVRRSVIGVVGSFGNFPSGEDIEYWARVAVNVPVAKTNQITSVYFRGNGGIMESLSESRVRGDNPIPGSALDLSPSLAFLLDSRSIRQAPFGRALARSIDHYVESRIDSAVKNAIRIGHVTRAKRYGTFYLKRRSRAISLWRLFSLMPHGMIRTLSGLWQLSGMARRTMRKNFACEF